MKFYVWRWTQRPLQLCKDFKPFTGLAEIAKNKGLRDNPEITHQAVASRCFHSELKMPGNMSLTLLSGETECMRTGWQITLSYHALSSYWGAKSYSFFRRSLKTHMNLKYQPQGPTYILHSLAFVEIRLFYIFSWKENQDSGYWYCEKEEGVMVHYVILYYVLCIAQMWACNHARIQFDFRHLTCVVAAFPPRKHNSEIRFPLPDLVIAIFVLASLLFYKGRFRWRWIRRNKERNTGTTERIQGHIGQICRWKCDPGWWNKQHAVGI